MTTTGWPYASGSAEAGLVQSPVAPAVKERSPRSVGSRPTGPGGRWSLATNVEHLLPEAIQPQAPPPGVSGG
jgi:hypothetical protein